MEYIGIVILPIIGGWILYAIMHAGVRAPGAALNKKFVSLGTLAGKTYDEISAVCGPSSSVSAGPNGKTIRQWMATGYHIVLIFDENGVCEGISSETHV